MDHHARPSNGRPGRTEQRRTALVTGASAGIGEAFLGTYILPFEVASVVLLAALIGAIVVSRKEVKG